MRLAGVKELKQKTMELLEESEKQDILITAYGKPRAVLHSITEEDLEDYLIENDPAFKTRIEEAYAEYLSCGGATVDSMIKKLGKRRGKNKV
jgi:prevent-host-death family protein